MKREAKEIVDRFKVLQEERRTHEAGWREIAKFMRPMRDEWRREHNTNHDDPVHMDPLVTDSTGMEVLDNNASGTYSFLSNEANNWFSIASLDDDLNNFHSVKQWLLRSTRTMLKSLAPAMSAFYSQAPELYADTPSFGTGAFFSEWRRGERKIFDAARSIWEIYIELNEYGEVDTVYRMTGFTPRQMEQKFGDAVSDATMKKIQGNEKGKIQIIHVVHPNGEFDSSKLGLQNFRFIDRYVELEESHELTVSGRRSLPYQIPRWSGTGKYGFGLGRRSLPDIKMVNAMEEGFLETLEWQNHPTVLMADEDQLEAARPVPRGHAYGAIDARGNRKIDFMAPDGNLPFTFEAIEAKRQQIRNAWIFANMQISNRTGLNEIESLELDEQKMRMMGPPLARLQHEFLSPFLKRRFAMLMRHGQIDDPPEELAGEELQFVYVSPMAAARKLAGARSTLRLADGMAGLAQINPAVADLANVDDMARTLQEGYQADPANLFSPEEVEDAREQRANQAQIEQQLAAGQQGADIAQKLGITADGVTNGGA